MSRSRTRLRVAALLVAAHILCFDSLAGIAFGMNAVDSHCKPTDCSCPRMTAHRQGHAPSAANADSCRRTMGAAPTSSPCGDPSSRETPPPVLRITAPVAFFEVAPLLSETASSRRPSGRLGSDSRDVETPPPR